MNTKQRSFTKLPPAIVLLAFLGSVSTVFPAVVTLTSQSHRIQGLAAGTDQSNSFDITGSAPLSDSASAEWWDGIFSPDQPGINHVYAAAGHFEVFARDDSAWTDTGSRAYADSSYTFRPLADTIGLHLQGQVELHAFENEIRFSLFDVTNGVELAAQSWTTEETDTLVVNWFDQFSVDPTFDYRLDLHAHVFPGDVPGVTSRLAAIFVVPEPGSLTLMAMAMAIWLRKKR